MINQSHNAQRTYCLDHILSQEATHILSCCFSYMVRVMSGQVPSVSPAGQQFYFIVLDIIGYLVLFKINSIQLSEFCSVSVCTMHVFSPDSRAASSLLRYDRD